MGKKPRREASIDANTGTDSALDTVGGAPPSSHVRARRKRRAVSAADPGQVIPYLPDVRSTKDGRIQVTMSLPVHLADALNACHLTILLTYEDLLKLVYADKQKLGEDLAKQCWVAELAVSAQQNPLPLRRRRIDAMIKLAISHIAKTIHLSVINQMKPRATQLPDFDRALQAVRNTTNPSPRATDITAWITERLFEQCWDLVGLRRPTAHVDRFAQVYLYTSPRVSSDPEAVADAHSFVAMAVQRLFPS